MDQSFRHSVPTALERMEFVMIRIRRLIVFSILILSSAPIDGASSGAVLQTKADKLVLELRELPAPMPGNAPSNGIMPPTERRRRELYYQIVQLRDDGVKALCRALENDDPRLRENAALALNMLAGGYFDSWPKLDIRAGLPSLIKALQDTDRNVRAWSAQAIASIGPDAKLAVPALIKLLHDPWDGARLSSCGAIRMMGPEAEDALPSLREASLNDVSADVRRCAEPAIKYVVKK